MTRKLVARRRELQYHLSYLWPTGASNDLFVLGLG